MENQNDLLAGIGVDDITQSHLVSIAKWNRFLAIIGIVGFGLLVLIMLFGGSYLATMVSSMGGRGMASSYSSAMFTGIFVIYAIIGVVFLIPCIYRLNFSNKMLKALAINDQQAFNDSLANLKIYSQYMGILTIIFIGVYGFIMLLFLFTVIAR